MKSKQPKAWMGKIPFNPKTGCLLAYAPHGTELNMPHRYIDTENCTWTDNYQFRAIIAFTGYGRGRSSAVFFAKDVDYKPRCQYDGPQFQFFMSEVERVIDRCIIKSGLIFTQDNGQPLYTFCKKGSNYSLQLIVEESK